MLITIYADINKGGHYSELHLARYKPDDYAGFLFTESCDNLVLGMCHFVRGNVMKKLLLGLCTYLILTSAALAAVNLNTATKEELDGVNGIGPVKAQAILDHRKKNGPFKSVDDLQNVKGFGNKSVGKIRSELTVGSSKSKAKISKKAVH